MNILSENERIEIVECKQDPKLSIEKFPKNEPGIINLSSLGEKINDCSKKIINRSKPIIRQKGAPLIYRKTINIIQGKAGAHKSRLAEHLASTLLLKNKSDNILELEKSEAEVIVVYVDTERNLEEQLPLAIQAIKLNAGYNISDDVPNFEFTSLMDISRSARLSQLESFLESLRQKYNQLLFVVIDVLTDCISNFNNVIESLEFIDLMNTMVNKYDITFLGVIHENPKMEEHKARGHIGTEIVNKASTVISVNRAKGTSNIFQVDFVKCRNSELYEPYYISFNASENRLEFADDFDLKSFGRSKAPSPQVMQFIIDQLNKSPLSRKHLISRICSKYECSERTAIERIDQIYSSNMVDKCGYKLILEDIPKKALNQKQYRLENLTPCG